MKLKTKIDMYDLLKSAYEKGETEEEILSKIAKTMDDVKADVDQKKQEEALKVAKDKVRSDTVDQIAGIVGELGDKLDMGFDPTIVYDAVNQMLDKVFPAPKKKDTNLMADLLQEALENCGWVLDENSFTVKDDCQARCIRAHRR